jgi:N6-adenosine-specific RNA methylase IME4
VKLSKRPEVKPITIGHFTLTAVGLDIKGRPSFEEWEGVGDFIKRTHQASGFWLADWLRYGDDRTDWRERLDQAVDVSGMSESTLKNVRAVARIEPARRRAEVSFSHHLEVAQCPPTEQTEWLDKTESHGWNLRELRLNMRASRRTRIIEGQAALTGMYRVIYADPGWTYSDSGPTADGSLGKAERHYPTMTIEELCKLPVEAHALPNSVLFMWCTAPMLLTNPGPREVIEAWGFVYKTGAVWDKVLGNFGHYFHVQHEHLLVCTRGSCLPDAPTPQPASVLHERRSNTHSEKPASMRKIIEQLYTTGPYLELFGRQPVAGWSVFGNDARLWAEEAAS